MTNGAGFIALAALIFGKWRPWTAFAGAMLFGFTRALGARLQILGVTVGDFSIPSEFWQSLPFVVTIVVVAGAVGRAIAAGRRRRPLRAVPMSRRHRLGRAAGRGRRGVRAAPTRRTPTIPVGAAGLVDDGRVARPRATSRTRPTGCHAVRRVRPRVRAPRHRRRPAGGGGVRRRRRAEPLVPCGRCRQLLHEHGGPELLFNGRPLGELLPDAFGPDHLARAT